MAGTWKERADVLIESMIAADPGSQEHDAVMVKALDLVNDRVDDDGLRGKLWGAMQYACENGHTEWFALEVGVEGPQHYHDEGTYIACAFYAGKCNTCKAPMSHVNWKNDQHFEPQDPDLPLPNGDTATQIFRLPTEKVKWCTNLDEHGVPQYQGDVQGFLQMNLAWIRLQWDRT